MMRFLTSCLLPLFLGCIAGPVRAQQALVLPDSSTLEVRAFDGAAVDAYKDRRAFDYGQRIRTKSPLQQWWDNLKERIADFLFGDHRGGDVLTLVAIVLLFLLLAMFFGKARFSRLFRRDPGADAGTLSVFDEEIATDDIQRNIVASEQAEDYRAALRWSFIGLLGSLDKAGLITAQRYKTNGDYRDEMASSTAYEAFDRVSRAFEYTWYGGHDIGLPFYRTRVQAIEEVRKLAGL